MPPKRQSSAAKQSKDTVNSNKKPKLSVDRDHQKQSSLTSFFASNSPTKAATSNGNGSIKGEADQDERVQEQDEASRMNDKGKGRAIQEEEVIDVDALSQQDWSIDQEEERLQIQKDEDFARSIQQEWNENGHDSSATTATTFTSTSSASTSKTQALAPLFRPKVKKEEAFDDDRKLLLQQSTSSTNISSPTFSSSSNTTQSRPQSTQSSPIKSKTTTAFNYAALEESINSIPLSEDIFSFDPTRIDTSSWPRATTTTTTTTSSSNPDSSSSPPTTPYALLTAAFVLISSTKSRLFITTVLTNLIRTIRLHDSQSLLASVYLVSNHIAPAYDGIELGLGGAITNKVIKEVTGISAQKMKTLWVSNHT